MTPPTMEDQTGALAALLGGYAPRQGAFDELLDPTGQPRAHWAPVLGRLARMGAEEVERAFGLADRRLRDSGVSYPFHDDGQSRERPWPLSHVPLVLSASEWPHIREGLTQRAELLDRVLADAYGPAELVRQGALPATLLAANPDFLRPVVGVPVRGRMLQVYATDLGRGSDGRWRVLGDRVQAPSGMGYALENRIALSRALPELYVSMNVQPVAPFFQAWRAALAAGADRDGSRIGLLTPGPLCETYVEHACLARHLGFLLVEGGDLTVRDGAVHVRTIGGLRKLDALVRRLDAGFADPVELEPGSQIGVPGLAQAVRAGSLVLANPLGAGLLEARALQGFLPALCRLLLGEELKLPGLETLWGGMAGERAAIRACLEALTVAPALGRLGGWPLGPAPVRVAELDTVGRALLESMLRHRGYDVVAQPPLTLSTMPVWRDGALEARPFTLRAFVVSTPDGWEVLPGGFCRLSERDHAASLSLQGGGRSADVWVPADGTVQPTTMPAWPDPRPVRRSIADLPSRAAEHLFWLGRYLERAEATLRAVRCLAGLAVENGETDGPARATTTRVMDILEAWGAAPHDGRREPGAALRATECALRGPECPGSVLRLVAEVRRTASVIRDRLSSDAGRALADLAAAFERGGATPAGPGEVLETADHGLRIISALSGLAQENMNRLSGWRFLDIGRRIERGILTGRFVRRFADNDASSTSLDALLELCDSQITYRARYLAGPMRAPVLDLLVFDDGNPRSMAFQVARIEEHVGALADLPTQASLAQPQLLVAQLARTMRTTQAHEVSMDDVFGVENRLMELSTEITAAFFSQAEATADDDVEDGG